MTRHPEVTLGSLGEVRDVSRLGAHPGQASAVRSNRSENNRRLRVRSEGQPIRKSSKRAQTGEPIVLVPDLRCLIDSITCARKSVSGATRWISDPVKDSNPLRNRSRHPFGSLIAIPRNPQAITRPVAKIQHCGVREDLSRDRWCEGDLATEVQSSAVSGVGRGSRLRQQSDLNGVALDASQHPAEH